VGPGFKEVFTPGYPADPEGRCLESDFAGREVQEIDFSQSNVHIGRFKAFDYFGDGSFYILDAPGHTIGHINALVRTNASPSPGFIHLGGDSIHHLAEIRPSEYLPLPDTITPSPLPDLHANSCPGHIFSSILRDGSKTTRILDWQDPEMGKTDPRFGLVYNVKDNRETVTKDEELDANRDIFTIIAHDTFLKGVIDEFPQTLNDWKTKGWKEDTTWKFLEDFGSAVA
jgi:glyoxylase-like metal-dependent hydrolase (beta-lactamase superfamily II)